MSDNNRFTAAIAVLNLELEKMSKDVLDFEKELHALYEVKLPVSASRIQAITKLAIKNYKGYKNVVFSIEKFIQKCPNELKLAAMYVIDSISRAASKSSSGDVKAYVSRFAEKLESMLSNAVDAPEKDREKIRKLLGVWKKSNIFDEELLKKLEKAYLPKELNVPAEFVPSNHIEPNSSTKPNLSSLISSLASAPSNSPVVSQAPQPEIISQIPQASVPPSNISNFQEQVPIATLPPNAPPPDAVLAHLLNLMGAGPNASSYAVPSFQSNQQNVVVSEDPNDFDYEDEDDGLNSKPLSARPDVMPSQNAFLPPNSSQISSNQMNMFAQFMTPSMPAAEEYSNLHFNPQNIQKGHDQGYQQQGYSNQQDISQIPMMAQQEEVNQQTGERDPYATAEPFLDPSTPLDAVRILSRTVYVGNIKSEITQSQMIQIIESLTELKIESFVAQPAKNCAFVKMYTRAHAEKLRELLPLFPFDDGSQFKIGWALGYGPREFFDSIQGTVTFPLSKLTDLDMKAITSAERGGMRSIMPGHTMEEPQVNIKEVGHGGGIGRVGGGRPGDRSISSKRDSYDDETRSDKKLRLR